MADSRNELDIHKSSGVSYRSVLTIVEEADKAERMLNEKRKEEMTSQELKNLGITFSEKSDYIKSQEFLNAALEKMKQETLPENEKNLIRAECCYGLANCERELGRSNEAIALFIKAKKQAEQITGEPKGFYDLKYLIARNIGIAYLIVENYENAADSFSDAVKIAETSGQIGRIPAVKSYYGLSLVLSEKDIAQGFKELAEARVLYPMEQRKTSMDFASNCYHWGLASESTKDYETAYKEFSESVRLRKENIDTSKINPRYYHSRVGDSIYGLGRAALALNRLEEAEKYLKEALVSFEELKATKKATAIRQSLLYISTQSTSMQISSTTFDPAPVPKQHSVNSNYQTPGLRQSGEYK